MAARLHRRPTGGPDLRTRGLFLGSVHLIWVGRVSAAACPPISKPCSSLLNGEWRRGGMLARIAE
jgi:hypothetical protein